MRSRRVLFAGLAIWLLASTAFSQDVGGSFLVKGVTTRFAYAYGFWKDQAPFADRLDLYVLLSDVPVADDAIPRNDDGIAKMAELVRNNKIHAFELHFIDPGKTLNPAESGAVYHNGIAPARRGLSGFLQFQPTAYDGRLLSGKVSMDASAVESAGFKIEATVRATVPPKK